MIRLAYFACVLLTITCFPARGELLISELMASNGHGLTDADGDTPDWIEIYNSGPDSVDLEGYTLTSDAADQGKWQLPAVSLEANGFLLVLASGKDRSDPNSELHTNFTLDADATYVALHDPTGTLQNEFDLAAIAQFEDVSYGVGQSGARVENTLLASRRPARVRVPQSDIGLNWTQPGFNDSTWQSSTTGVGYERGSGYESLIGSNSDVEDEMYETNGSVYIRVPFEASDSSGIVALTLRMKYDDGFAAFLNGVRVADANAPATLRWNSTATGQHDDSAAVVFDEFDITEFARELKIGTNVLAIQGLNTNLTSSDLIIMPEVRIARLTNAQLGEPGYLSRATPGAFNSDSFDGFVRDTKFSVDRGFFTDPFTLEITSATEDAVIRFTTDGSDPTEGNGTVYTGPVTISETTALRAAAFKDGLVPSNIDTHTYLFLEDVVRQSPNDEVPEGWPGDGEVNGQEMRYGMSQRVVDQIHNPEEVIEALRSVPSFSVVTPLANLFDRSRGIYTNPGNDGRNWERPTSLELLNPDGTKGFQVGAGIRIRGGFSRTTGNPKHAFRLFFRREYGNAKLRYPLFGDEGVDEFDNVDLRTTQNYSWGFQGDSRNLFLRDVFSRDLQGKMGHPYTRSRFYHLYLNGVYWGLFQTQERAEASFAESYLGGDKEDYDVVSKFGSTTDGNRDAYRRLWEEATAGFTSNQRYFRVQGLNTDGTTNPEFERLLDVGNVIDYMILTYHTGDRDGPGSRFTQPNPNNYFGIYNRENPDGFKFFEHDSEHSLDTGEPNMVSPFTSGSSASQFNPHWLHERLMRNAIYKERFIDRVQEVFFNDGLLTAENAIALIDQRAMQIDQAIIAESARWGWLGRESNPYTRTTWLGALNTARNWLTTRNDIVIEQLRDVGWFPDTGAPEFVQPGGAVEPGFGIQFRSGAGTLYYTLDGEDPRGPNGSLNPNARIAEPAREIATRLLDENSAATALVPTANIGASWRSAGFNDTTWSKGTAGVGYDNNSDYDQFIDIDVSEMDGTNGSVYIRVPFEVDAPQSFTELRLSMRYDDGFVAYLNGTVIASANAPGNPSWNDTATSGHDDSAAESFEAFDVSDHIDLLQQGANILAIHGLNTSTTSSDMLISPRLESVTISGGGSVELPEGVITVNARVRDGNEWSALSVATFQVGIIPANADNTVITELHYHPAAPTEAEIAAGFIDQDQFEFLELRNFSDARIELGDSAFTEGIAFTFPVGTVLEPGDFVVLASDPAAFASRYGNGIVPIGTYQGNLANSGERLRLADADGVTIVDFSYNDRGSWPRLPDGDGYSLTLVSDTTPDALGDASAWRTSAMSGGSPESSDALDLASWRTTHFSAAERANALISGDGADPDGDGLGNLAEYATGSNPRFPEGISPLSIESEIGAAGARVRIGLSQASASDDALAIAQFSTNLVDWVDIGVDSLDLDGESAISDGITRRLWEIDTSPQNDEALHFRFRFELR